jgi:hypothetical protein
MRHDEKYLKLLHDHGSLIYYNQIRELPFFYFVIPEKWRKDEKTIDIEIVKNALPNPIVMEEIIPFPHFSFIIDQDPCLHMFSGVGASVQIVDLFRPRDYPVPEEERILIENGANVDKGIWFHNHRMELDVVGKRIEYDCESTQFYRHKQLAGFPIIQGQNPTLDVLYERNRRDCGLIWMTLISLLHHAEENHRRLIHVAPIVRKRTKGQGISTSRQYTSKHHYVYLDGPPARVMTDTELGEVTIHRRGHHRRAHWHRLSHERFKNHPMYGKRIRVKASWIGPTEWIDEGKIYTLHNPEEL